MITEVIAGLISAALIAFGALSWRHRTNLRLLRTTLLPFGEVRVSYSAMLRVRDDDRYILFDTPSRPNCYGPPGGVFKYTDFGRPELEESGFQDERKPTALAEDRRRDLRGLVGAGSAVRFVIWFGKGEGRESATECLRRELIEELDEVDHPELASDVATLAFTHVRTVNEGPRREHGREHLLLRRFEIYDVALIDEGAARFQRRLADLAGDPSSPKIISASVDEIRYGRCEAGLIGGHTAYLFGRKRYYLSPPPVR